MSANDSIQELDIVALLRDRPDDDLRSGQTGTVVFVHREGEAFEVEFQRAVRDSIVATVPRDELLKLRGLSTSAPSMPS